MPRKDNILNLPGFAIKKVSGCNPLVIDVHYRKVPRCVHCNQKRLRKKASFIRHVRHESIGLDKRFSDLKPINSIAMPVNAILTNSFLG